MARAVAVAVVMVLAVTPWAAEGDADGGGTGTAAVAMSPVVERVAGGSRVETAVAVSRRLFPEGGCRGSTLCSSGTGPEVVGPPP